MPELTELIAKTEAVRKNTEEMLAKVAEMEKNLASKEERIHALETQMKDAKTYVPGLEGKEKKPFSISRAIIAIVNRGPTPKFNEFEWDAMQQATKLRDGSVDMQGRAVFSTQTDSTGGFAVPAQYLPEWIELLRAKVVCEALGARRLTGLVGSPVYMPKQATGATGYWIAENASITESEATIGQAEMTPHCLAAFSKVSNRTLQLANPSIDALIRDDMIKVLARKEDLACLRGGVAAGEPIGILNTPNVGSVTSIGQPNEDDLWDIMYEVMKDDAFEGSLGWAMNPREWNTFMKLKDGNGRPLILRDTAGQGVPMQSLQGYPLQMTTQIPITGGTGSNESEIFFGNWSELLIGQWAGISILASNVAGDAMQYNQTYVRILEDVDTLVRHGESFCYGSGVTT